MPDETRDRRRLFLHAGGSIASSLADTAEHLGKARNAVFVAYAVHDHEAYAAHMGSVFDTVGVALTGLHVSEDPRALIASADAIVVGGGNTFRLMKTLYDLDVLPTILDAVNAGVPYWGASAGSNVACPTIRTTNDMPIVEPPSLNALGLVPFQINPHYVDEPVADGDVKETREFRINEFLEDNDVPVVGLREGSWLIVNDHRMTLHGSRSAALFQRAGREELHPGSDVSYLLDIPASFDTPLGARS